MAEHQQPQQHPVEGPDEIDLLDYLEIILKRKKMIVYVTAAAFLLSIVIALILPKKYESTARILPPQQDQGLMGLMLGGLGGAGGGMASLESGLLGTGTSADMYASILQSEAIKDTIIDRFKLMDLYHKDYRLDMYEKLDKLVDIVAGKKDGIITITVEDEEPKRAADIANAYVEELGKLAAGLNITGAGQNRSFYETRLAKAKADLARAEEALKNFQSKNKALDIMDQAKSTIEGVAMLRAQLAMLEVQLDTLRRQFTETSQEVKTLKATIGNVKAQIASLEGNKGGGSIPSVGSVPALGQQYVRLMREFKIQEAIVELLTKQYEMAKLTEAKDLSTIQVIQQARVPDKKVKPRRIRMVLLTTFLAFASSVGFVLARSHFDDMPLATKQRIRNIMFMMSPWITSKLWK